MCPQSRVKRDGGSAGWPRELLCGKEVGRQFATEQFFRGCDGQRLARKQEEGHMWRLPGMFAGTPKISLGNINVSSDRAPGQGSLCKKFDLGLARSRNWPLRPAEARASAIEVLAPLGKLEDGILLPTTNNNDSNSNIDEDSNNDNNNDNNGKNNRNDNDDD
eukprot:gene12271-biopygen447